MIKNENINIVKSVQLDVGVIELRSDNILTFEPSPGTTTIQLEDLTIMLEVFIEITDGIPRPYLSNNSKTKSFGYDERAYVAKTIHQFASACAIIENSTVTRFITHIIIHMFKPKIPFKMFKTKTNAIAWLSTFKTPI